MWFSKKSRLRTCKESTNHRLLDRYNNNAPVLVTAPVLLIILILSIIISTLCFAFRSSLFIKFIPGQKAKATVIADKSFIYESEERTRIEKNRIRNQLAPVYSMSFIHYDRFEKEVFALDDELDNLSKNLEGEKIGNAYMFELRNFVRKFNDRYNSALGWGDVDVLLKSIDENSRTAAIIEALHILRDVLADGVYSNSDIFGNNEAPILNIEIKGNTKKSHVRSEDDAIKLFRIRLSAMDWPLDLKQSLFRIMKKGIAKNLSYDEDATNAKILKMIQDVEPVKEEVHAGDIIVEAGTVVKSSVRERLMAYYRNIDDLNTVGYVLNSATVKIFITTFIILLLSFLCLKMAPGSAQSLSKNFLLMLTILFTNLIILRAIFQIGEVKHFRDSEVFVHMLPYINPFYLSTILCTLLIRTYVGVVIGGLVSILFTMMLAENIEFMLMCILVVFIAAHYCRRASLRSQVIYGGMWSAMVFSFSSISNFWTKDITYFVCLWQVFCCLMTGIVTTMFSLGILPLFEKWFKCCTNLRLVELTDYSHELMRNLQILAPGTYHHSLIVANIAEQAAIAMNANSFLCRTSAMYHDIGKIIKPEYFTENQRAGFNPHDEKTPFVSAIIIKTHVRDGIAMAERAGIPPRVINGIREHHGTSLIRYFYNKALQQIQQSERESELVPIDDPKAAALAAEAIDEAVFRYDGPTPRSKETAILMVADSLEAASRSMKNINPQSVKILVDNIIDEKVVSHQLDDCSMTLKEINELRKALYSIMVNMLHSRVSYDDVSKK
ncbi:MAG: HDIG domain-containing protein [Puniceicoccales bacterium]|jgi:putative nucleotidyltransferase with HDIG domain|nr:HDIG domain-containing protein [Puniceicoccales bacterium]